MYGVLFAFNAIRCASRRFGAYRGFCCNTSSTAAGGEAAAGSLEEIRSKLEVAQLNIL